MLLLSFSRKIKHINIKNTLNLKLTNSVEVNSNPSLRSIVEYTFP